MKILFIGSVQFSYHLLEDLLLNDANVIGICSSKSSQRNADYCDLSKLAHTHKIPFHQTNNLEAEMSLNWIKKINADIIFCFGWSRIITNKLLKIPQLGVVGYHPTLLPKNRGRHPIIWALVLGLSVTGSTFFFMDDGVDSGPIISQKKVKISKKDDAGSLYQKLIETAKFQLSEIIRDFSNNELVEVKQDENIATYWRKRSLLDGIIDWRMDAQLINNLIRALANPYPNAEFYFAGVRYKAVKGTIFHESLNETEPGKIIHKVGNSFAVQCGRGAILIEKTLPLISGEIGDYIL